MPPGDSHWGRNKSLIQLLQAFFAIRLGSPYLVLLDRGQVTVPRQTRGQLGCLAASTAGCFRTRTAREVGACGLFSAGLVWDVRRPWRNFYPSPEPNPPRVAKDLIRVETSLLGTVKPAPHTQLPWGWETLVLLCLIHPNFQGHFLIWKWNLDLGLFAFLRAASDKRTH